MRANRHRARATDITYLAMTEPTPNALRREPGFCRCGRFVCPAARDPEPLECSECWAERLTMLVLVKRKILALVA